MYVSLEKPTFWRTWGVSLVFAVLLVGIAITTIVLSHQSLGRAPATPPPSAVVGTKETEFTAVGIQYANQARFVSINLTDVPVSASRIALPASGSATVPARDLGSRLRLINGNKNVTLTGIGQVSVFTSAGAVTTVVYSVAGLSVEESRQRLLADVASLGISSSEVSAATTNVRVALRSGTGYEDTFGAGEIVGDTVVAHLACTASGDCTLTYTVTVPTD